MIIKQIILFVSLDGGVTLITSHSHHLDFCECAFGCVAIAFLAWIHGISVASSGRRLIVDENDVRFDNIWNNALRENPILAENEHGISRNEYGTESSREHTSDD